MKFLQFILYFCFINVLTAQNKPNILLIVADDLGWGDVGYNGQTKIKTPVIDALAKQGMVFKSFYAGSTVCTPSRVSLMTGKHTGHTRVRGNVNWNETGKPIDIIAKDITVAEKLKEAGYRTGVIGKWGLAENLDEGKPNKQGFDEFYGFNTHIGAHHYYPDSIWINDVKTRIEGNNFKLKEKHYIQDNFTDQAKSFITSTKEQPFFLYLAYTTPHFEITVPEDSKEPYKNLGWPIRNIKHHRYLHDTNTHVSYAGMVSRLDTQIGELLDLLKNMGIEENTLVIFTSDNGHMYDDLNDEFFNSNGPFKGKKRDLYEGGLRVPFVARWTGVIPQNTTTSHRAAFWDLLPTFCDLAGVSSTKDTDGISLKPTLLGKHHQKKHDYFYWEFNEIKGPVQALIMGEYKIVKKYQSPTELYHLKTDVSEQNNLAIKHPNMVKKMEKKLKKVRYNDPNYPLEKLNQTYD
ncbi:hypothetical protein AXE80_04430 [Wenyingzhuangia fucanilytica]|uniref:Sulfatase N-terminal domain-containing protein n=1 Tax=Wenyingzhuangia fucanilytica TaxID=1790137 RepID=A0A1B1Y495_9FLAO|nr:arylsulfatase [Wenyingzhuangia fucanilytica]ANW95567.1 hypothetical protein AXE80_04430 [Wenyingzhuangia fucanilytica]